MKHHFLIAILTLLALASGLHANKLEDIQAVARANQQFYQALNAMFEGDAEPMAKVWSHAGDVTCLGPDNSFVTGWDQVNAHWKHQADLKLGGRVRPANEHVFLGGELAVVQNYEVGKNFNHDGKQFKVKLRATNVYRKIEGEWKMVSHHTDLLPELMRKQ